MRKTVFVAAIASAAMTLGVGVTQTVSQADSGSYQIAQIRGSGAALTDSYGIQVPDVNYRRDWVQLGTFSIRADEAKDGAGQLHIVYAPKEAVEKYRSGGDFPSGTILVKDVFKTKSEDLPTGFVSYAHELAGRFVMVRDKEGKLAGKNPLWGDGWGWAFFEGNEKVKTVTTDYKADCLGCHQPAKDTNWLYVRGYPVLGNK
ncbi:MAG: cytochrome P460 family protein [Hyphomicrobiaceae bacterium]|nr:cytochrome P460 family protein [Hyphomicrobiaceae bacterium]